jgi:pyruvate dehydrogenase complex dehydrogenase (E1) component
MFEPGHKFGRGNRNSGRKSLAEEINKVKEKITQEALIELANKKVFAAINGANNHDDIKEIALPITLKGMIDKKEIKGKFNFGKMEELTNEQLTKLADENSTGDGEKDIG